MEVVAEGLNVRYNLLASLSLKVSREQDKGNVSNLSLASREPLDGLEFQRRVIAEKDLGCVLNRSPSRVDEFLARCQQHSSKRES
jgi:hypothetical protein